MINLFLDYSASVSGTMRTACDLFTEAQANLLGCICLVELKELNGRAKIQGVPFHSMIQY